MDKISELINSVVQTREAKNYFAMMATSLALIDICSSIEFHSEGLRNNERYKKWIEFYLEPKLTAMGITDYLDKTNIWFLRNSFLHEGSANPNTNKDYQKYGNRIVTDIVPTIFDESKRKVIVTQESNGNEFLFFDIFFFVDMVIDVVREWQDKSKLLIEQHDNKIFSVAVMVTDKETQKSTIMRIH